MTDLLNKLKGIFATKTIDVKLQDKLKAIVFANKADITTGMDDNGEVTYHFERGAIRLHNSLDCDVATVHNRELHLDTRFLVDMHAVHFAELRRNELTQVLAVLNATK